MHLVGFITRIYHDARSAERQKPTTKAKEIRTSDVANLAPASQKLPIAISYPRAHFTRPPATRYGHGTPAFIRRRIWPRQVAYISKHVGLCHAGQPNRNQVTAAAGTAIEARGKPQRCFACDLHSAAQPHILNYLVPYPQLLLNGTGQQEV